MPVPGRAEVLVGIEDALKAVVTTRRDAY